MFLFSGVLAPFWPRIRSVPGPGVSGAPSQDAGPIPVAVRSIVAEAPTSEGWRALSGESSLFMDALGRGFIPVRTHLGCLVADGDPVVRPGTRAAQPLVEAFVDLSRAGGRIPVFREASPTMAKMYRQMGFSVRRSGERARIDLLDGGSLVDDTPLARGADWLRAGGLSTEVLSETEAVGLHRWLAVRSPGLDVSSLQGSSVVCLRQGRKVRAWARLWVGEVGGAARLDRIRPADGPPPGAVEALLVGAVGWAREQGASALVLPRNLPRATVDRLERSLPVRGEARYTAAPEGWRARAASVLLRLHPLGLVLPV